MEKKKHRIKRKRKEKPSAHELHRPRSSYANAIFAPLLASLYSRPNYVIFINKCLFKLRCSLLISQTSLTSTLALLPTLLCSTRVEIVCLAANIIGATSLVSFDANEEIASDSETVKGLISLLHSRKRKVFHHHLHPSIIAQIFRVEQIDGFECVYLWPESDGSFRSLKIRIMEDKLSLVFLTATVALINACEVEQLQGISQCLFEAFLGILKQIRVRVSDEEVIKGAGKWNEEGHLCKSSITVSNLAECIFRLFINASQLSGSLSFEVVQRGFFGASDTSFKDFISNYWEVSPFLLAKTVRDLDMHDMFGAFLRSLSWNGSVPFLSSILQGLVACFPIASNEQNILNFLHEAKDRLGCLIVYQ